jgi:hypothetical protein
MIDKEGAIVAGCHGKERFECKTYADRVARRKNQSKQQKSGLHSEAYRCRTCGGFHVGSSPSDTKRHKRKVFMDKRERPSYEDLSFDDDFGLA